MIMTAIELRPCDTITLEVRLPRAFGLRYRVGLALLKAALWILPFGVEINHTKS